MRAVIKTGPGPGCDLVTDRVEPDLRPGEVRIQVAAASVCGTDASLFASGDAGSGMGMRFPLTLGHEVGGTVVEIGPLTGGLTIGTRVAVETHLHCGECFFCRHGDAHNCARLELLGITVDGAFAERLVVPARNCFLLPDGLATHTAALLEPGGSAMHAVLRSGIDLAGAAVLVLGAGPVGLVAAQVALAVGAREVTVVEPNSHRRRAAEALGATTVDAGDDPLQVAGAATRSRGGYDLSLECSGALPAMRAAVVNVRREGTVVAVGLVKGRLELDVTDTLITRGLTLRGSWGRSIWGTWDRLAELVDSGRVDLDTLITHRLPLSGLPTALDLMASGAGKVLLVPALPDEALPASEPSAPMGPDEDG
ncbi:zinc-binding dehydrogenase [Oryzobacter telluris]|uniref:zinc-dependent alcohol dehydrogenase n=1 Tax=Oryzobacter telluris TaxID=3149179 RepID=UPI00370D9EEF